MHSSCTYSSSASSQQRENPDQISISLPAPTTAAAAAAMSSSSSLSHLKCKLFLYCTWESRAGARGGSRQPRNSQPDYSRYILTYVSMRSDRCGTKYLRLGIALRFLTRTKCSTGFRPFLTQADARKSSTVMASRRKKVTSCSRKRATIIIKTSKKSPVAVSHL